MTKDRQAIYQELQQAVKDAEKESEVIIFYLFPLFLYTADIFCCIFVS